MFVSQNELQKDFDLVQSMLENKQREMDTLSQELTDNIQPSDIQVRTITY